MNLHEYQAKTLLQKYGIPVPRGQVISVAKHDPTYSTIREVRELPKHTLIEIEHFFTSYKELEGKHVRSFGWHGVREARRAIQRAAKAFAKTVHLSSRDSEADH